MQGGTRNVGGVCFVACLVGVDGLGALEHEPESLGASKLSPVRSNIQVGSIEGTRARVGGLASQGRDACRLMRLIAVSILVSVSVYTHNSTCIKQESKARKEGITFPGYVEKRVSQTARVGLLTVRIRYVGQIRVAVAVVDAGAKWDRSADQTKRAFLGYPDIFRSVQWEVDENQDHLAQIHSLTQFVDSPEQSQMTGGERRSQTMP